MKNLIFKIKWLLKFRLSLGSIKEKRIAIVVDNFIDDASGRQALDLYNFYLGKGYTPFILCAFNKAPMGRYLKDLRHIYIFNNSPEIFVQFCHRKQINILHYVDKDLMLNAAHQFGFKIIFSLCTLQDPGLAQRLSAADCVVFADSGIADAYSAMGFGGNGSVLAPETDYTENL
ncbi:MAG: hypothetical protein IKJ05_01040 [Oscillospiraceae bacterium]|nr:hypothetical protein [Oscillospiraceae bacterium]